MLTAQSLFEIWLLTEAGRGGTQVVKSLVLLNGIPKASQVK